MIGRWLDLLTTEEEDRLLTQPFGVQCYHGVGVGCLMQVALGALDDNWTNEPRADRLHRHGRLGRSPLFLQYDNLRRRWKWDDARVNALIRNRILRNRARRALTQSPELVGSTPEGEPHND